MRIINHVLELVDIISREQLGDVSRVVAAQEHGAAFDDGLQVVEHKLFDAVEDGGEFGEEAAACGLGGWCGHWVGVGVWVGEGEGQEREEES
ncbi:hypothetical protein GB937_005309 [Aspergillus fischeri]|nr:hypothetical protein GB937_005309 [Aspergillus fischeri]